MEIDQLRQENEELQRALSTVERHLQTIHAEKEQLSVLHLEFKAHYDQMRQQTVQYQQRLGEEVQARKDIESSMEQRLGDMRRAIEQKQREIESLANKISLPIDTDILRMKIQKDIDMRHRVELDSKQQENDRLSEHFYEAKRQTEILKTQLDAQRQEFERELTDSKEKNRRDTNDLLIENQALQSKADDKRDRELIRQLRRDLDEQKRRVLQIQSENNDLRRERDIIKNEKNEQFVQMTREIEETQSSRRQLESDLERSDFRYKSQTEEMQKLQLKCERKQADCHKAVAERNANESNIKHRDALIDSLQKQISQMKEDYRMVEHQTELLQRSRAEIERQHEQVLKDERERYQREIDRLDKRSRNEEQKNAQTIQSLENRTQTLQTELINAHAETKQLAQALSQEKLQVLTSSNQLKLQEKELQQVQLELLQLKTVNSQQTKQSPQVQFDTNKKDDGTSARLQETAKQELQTIRDHYEKQMEHAKAERAELVQRCRELEHGIDRVKIESSRHINHYKTKYSEYKAKMRKANQNIAILMARIAKFDLQMAAEKEDHHNYVGDVALNAAQGHSPPDWAGDQLQDLLSNDGLNEEIRKLLAENINY